MFTWVENLKKEVLNL